MNVCICTNCGKDESKPLGAEISLLAWRLLKEDPPKYRCMVCRWLEEIIALDKSVVGNGEGVVGLLWRKNENKPANK